MTPSADEMTTTAVLSPSDMTIAISIVAASAQSRHSVRRTAWVKWADRRLAALAVTPELAPAPGSVGTVG